MSSHKFDLYQTITNQLIDIMESGTKPWTMPFDDSCKLPKNFKTGESYKGINIILLWVASMSAGYKSPLWITFNQAKSLGAKINKGEKSTMITFYKTKEIEEDGETKTIPVIKYYRVFNIEQTNIEVDRESEDKKVNKNFDENVENKYCEIEQLIINNLGVKSIDHNSGSAYYKPDSDTIHLPPKKLFYCSKEMAATLIHEAIHATGHKSRLDRFSGKNNRFKSYDYSVEEIIAESASVFVLAELGINSDIHGHASYIESWIKHAKKDKRFLFKVFSDASKAAEFFLEKIYKNEKKIAA